MMKEELIVAVPIHTRRGRPYRIVLNSIPTPWRAQFANALIGSACPLDDGLGPCAFAWDWIAWVNGDWHGQGPVGLDDQC